MFGITFAVTADISRWPETLVTAVIIYTELNNFLIRGDMQLGQRRKPMSFLRSRCEISKKAPLAIFADSRNPVSPAKPKVKGQRAQLPYSSEMSRMSTHRYVDHRSILHFASVCFALAMIAHMAHVTLLSFRQLARVWQLQSLACQFQFCQWTWSNFITPQKLPATTFLEISKQQWALFRKNLNAPIWPYQLTPVIEKIIIGISIINAVIDVSSIRKMSATTEKVILKAASNYHVSLIFEDFRTFLETPGTTIYGLPDVCPKQRTCHMDQHSDQRGPGGFKCTKLYTWKQTEADWSTDKAAVEVANTLCCFRATHNEVKLTKQSGLVHTHSTVQHNWQQNVVKHGLNLLLHNISVKEKKRIYASVFVKYMIFREKSSDH